MYLSILRVGLFLNGKTCELYCFGDSHFRYLCRSSKAEVYRTDRKRDVEGSSVVVRGETGGGAVDETEKTEEVK